MFIRCPVAQWLHNGMVHRGQELCQMAPAQGRTAGTMWSRRRVWSDAQGAVLFAECVPQGAQPSGIYISGADAGGDGVDRTSLNKVRERARRFCRLHEHGSAAGDSFAAPAAGGGVTAQRGRCAGSAAEQPAESADEFQPAFFTHFQPRQNGGQFRGNHAALVRTQPAAGPVQKTQIIVERHLQAAPIRCAARRYIQRLRDAAGQMAHDTATATFPPAFRRN